MCRSHPHRLPLRFPLVLRVITSKLVPVTHRAGSRPTPPASASALSHLGPIPQDVFGALFRSLPSLDTRLKLTLNRTRRDAVLTEDFTGAKLLADHPFLADSEQLAQSEASHSPWPQHPRAAASAHAETSRDACSRVPLSS